MYLLGLMVIYIWFSVEEKRILPLKRKIKNIKGQKNKEKEKNKAIASPFPYEDMIF